MIPFLSQPPTKYLVGVSDMRVSSKRGEVLVAHALGSCLGIAIHDPVAEVGALLHVQLPLSTISLNRAVEKPDMFVDIAVPRLFRAAYAAGADRKRLVITVAGGNTSLKGVQNDGFTIGKRNYVTLKKILWRNGLLIHAEDVGGHAARTMYLEIGTGRVWISSANDVREL